MSTDLQEETPAVTQADSLNAEAVTSIATGFLKRIGNKNSLKPKRVSVEEGICIVEIEMKKRMATVRIDAETHQITEYEIQSKAEETSITSISPRLIILVFGISAVVYVALNYAFEMFGL